MDISKSLISRSQSQWTKGILILLIVLGHNGILMGKYEGMQKTALNGFLYCFHVYAFFFLTCLYNWKPFSREELKKNLRKLYVPYTIMFCVVCIINTLLTSNFPDPIFLLVGYFTGADPAIDRAIGMSFLWFLPTMFSFRILLSVLATTPNKNMFLKYSIIVASIVILFMSIIGKWSINNETWAISGSWAALRVLPFCIFCRYLFEKFSTAKWYQIFVYCGSFVSMVLYFKLFSEGCKHMSYFKYGIIPFYMFQTLALVSSHIKYFHKTIMYFGQHSLDIYLIHILVYNVLVRLLKYLGFSPTIMVGFVVLILTILLTVAFNYVFGKVCPRGYRLLYSKEWPD